MSFTEAVSRVAPFVSHDVKRPVLRHVLVEPTRVVATDTHRLVVVEGTFDVETRTLVDPETLAEVPGADEFPDVERFLAAPASSTVATVDAGELLDAIERATGDDEEPLAVTVVDGQVRLGEQATLHVDAGYLHDAVEAVGAGPVGVELVDDRSPMAIRGTDVLVLVMPVRVAASRS